jgi:hypothetical protein
MNPSYVIDCESAPFDLSGANLVVLDHRTNGKVIWDSSKFTPWLYSDQRVGRSVEVNVLYRELMSKNVMNACVLDFLLVNTHLIPSVWRDRSLYFWGTIYSYPGTAVPYVRFLVWQEYANRWVWGYCGMAGYWNSTSPALVMQS